MKEYIYVICYYHDGDPAFRHTNVYADSENDAYGLGHKWTDETMPEFSGKFINDYVIEVSR